MKPCNLTPIPTHHPYIQPLLPAPMSALSPSRIQCQRLNKLGRRHQPRPIHCGIPVPPTDLSPWATDSSSPLQKLKPRHPCRVICQQVRRKANLPQLYVGRHKCFLEGALLPHHRQLSHTNGLLETGIYLQMCRPSEGQQLARLEGEFFRVQSKFLQ